MPAVYNIQSKYINDCICILVAYVCLMQHVVYILIYTCIYTCIILMIAYTSLRILYIHLYSLDCGSPVQHSMSLILLIESLLFALFTFCMKVCSIHHSFALNCLISLLILAYIPLKFGSFSAYFWLKLPVISSLFVGVGGSECGGAD